MPTSDEKNRRFVSLLAGCGAAPTFQSGPRSQHRGWLMKAYVYILKGSSGRFYIGSTSNIENRFAQHLRGHTHSTKRLGETLEIVFSQEFSSIEQARLVEKRIKSWKRRDFIEKIIKDGKIKFVK